MSGNSREWDKLRSTSKQDRDSLARVNASGQRLQDSPSEILRWPNDRDPSECSAEYAAQTALNLIRGKWKTRILSRLEHGPVRLGELSRSFPQASKKMLAQHLREMERDGLVVRRNLSRRVLHVEYSLSDSGGRAVLCLISTLRESSRTNLPFRTEEQDTQCPGRLSQKGKGPVN
jgi:DNA-binding HxlR family transcriptional regulator